MTEKNIHTLGQYFTTNRILKDKVYEFILNNPLCILEPSIGQGDLVDYIKSRNKDVKFDMYEIDNSIEMLKEINKCDVIYGDFMKIKIDKKYKTIIGNPPYVRTKTGNLYIDFTDKCYNLLDENGELIFIIPSDFFKLTSSSKLLDKMMLNGTFTHIYHPHNEKLFDGANIDVIVYRYNKNPLLEKKVIYNDKIMYISNIDGLITFNDKIVKQQKLFKDYFDIYVGIVSEKEDIYKNDKLGNITVINGENKKDKYILIDKYPSKNTEINDYLIKHKEILMKREIRKFNEKNWFEWGALRNFNIMANKNNEDCIYMYNLSRKQNIAFIDKVSYFGGSLIMLKPKIKCDLQKVVNYLNSEKFKSNFMFSGRFKIGHRQISNSFFDDNILL